MTIRPTSGFFWTDGGDAQADLEIQRRRTAVATRIGQIATAPLTVAEPAGCCAAGALTKVQGTANGRRPRQEARPARRGQKDY